MNILKIIKKEIIQNLRDVKILVILAVMPLFIILLMGLAIEGAFNQTEVTVEEIAIEYQIIGNETDFTDGLLTTLAYTGSQTSVNDDQNQAVISVNSNDIDAYLTIKSMDNTVEFYFNDEYNIKSSVIQSIISSYIRQYNVSEITGVKTTTYQPYTTTEVIQVGKKASAMDYYGVAMTILFGFYGIPLTISSLLKEKQTRTLNRILLTPAKRFDIFLGKTFGGLLVSLMQVGFIMVGTIIFFNVNWGNLFYASALVFTMLFLLVAIGVFIGTTFDNEGKAMGFIHILLPLFALFGGSYMPLNEVGFFGQVGKFFSPIWWNMQGLLSMIYGQSTDKLFQAMIVNISSALLILGFTTFIINRKEHANG